MKEFDNHYHFLDILKGFCIIFICITHFDWNNEERLALGFPFLIDMAVPVFMLISGYVNAISYEHHKISRIGQTYKMGFLCKKFLRFTIPFLIVFCFETGISVVAFQTEFTLLNCVRSFLVGGGGPGSYYFPIMIQLILLYPIVYFVMKKHPTRGLAVFFGINAFWEFLQWAVALNTSVYRLLIFRYLFLIAAGCYLYFYKGKDKVVLRVLSCFIGLVFIVMNQYLGYETKILNPDWSGTSFIAVLFIIPIFFIVHKNFQKMTFKPLEILGKASFDIFLAQKVYYYLFYPFVQIQISSRAIKLSVSMMICICAGLVLYFIETPITKRITQKISFL